MNRRQSPIAHPQAPELIRPGEGAFNHPSRLAKNGGPDIGIAGHPANHATYKKTYDNYQKNGDSDSARNAIGKQFDKGEHTSTTGQAYAD